MYGLQESPNREVQSTARSSSQPNRQHEVMTHNRDVAFRAIDEAYEKWLGNRSTFSDELSGPIVTLKIWADSERSK